MFSDGSVDDEMKFNLELNEMKYWWWIIKNCVVVIVCCSCVVVKFNVFVYVFLIILELVG